MHVCILRSREIGAVLYYPYCPQGRFVDERPIVTVIAIRVRETGEVT